jgi:ArsR family transcriptional regulator, arsenate/arsenite/antimonite-responsive transcriptional repressor / arsenate reductase (thioredoxin)
MSYQKPNQRAYNVLFLCDCNSGQSLIAEAILGTIDQGRFIVHSAGLAPARRPLPEVMAKLAMLGHDVSGLRSKSLRDFLRPGATLMDFVILLTDDQNREALSALGAGAVTAVWPMPDPARFAGGPAERAVRLNELYARMWRWLSAFNSLPAESLDRIIIEARSGRAAVHTVFDFVTTAAPRRRP